MPKKSTTCEFVKKAIKIHGDKYDYSLVDYKNKKTKIKIICPIHGIFEQTPESHLKGSSCQKCGINKAVLIRAKNNKINSEFIKKVLNKSKNFEIQEDNFFCRDKIHLKCKKCGNVIIREAYRILQRNTKCDFCFNLNLNTKQFVLQAKLVHNDFYDYSLVDYKNSHTKIKIICPEHGEFEQIAYSHLNGHGCPYCSGGVKLTKDIFVKKANKIHYNKYDYSKSVYIDSYSKIEIICPKHGSFWQKVNRHISGDGCPKCKFSKAEDKISRILKNIEFESQKKFDDLKDKSFLSYDFYIPSKKLLIEYNGEQHYRSVDYFGGEKQLHLQKHHDWLKRKYAKKNGYDLLVIPYWEFENIEKILEEKLK